MQEPIARHSYVHINGSMVHLLQYGFGENLFRSPSLADSFQASSSFSTQSISSGALNTTNDTNTSNAKGTISEVPKKLIIFVPGNPGLLGVYHDFLVSLFRIISGNSLSSKNRQTSPTLLCMSHNNFDHPDHVQYRAEERLNIDENDMNFVEQSLAKKYSGYAHHIELQVLNKLVILKRMLKVDIENCRLIFIGHSIGCYVILRLLQDRLISSSHESSILLHPALENLALTQKGSRLNTLFNYRVDLLVIPLAFVVDKLLPRQAKTALTKWFLPADLVHSASEIVIESIAQLGCSTTLKALIQMARSELALVGNLNAELMIRPHASKLKLIYAIDDHWVNTENRQMLRDNYPDLHIEERPTSHAFTMNPDTVMDYAVRVGLLIQDALDNIELEVQQQLSYQQRRDRSS